VAGRISTAATVFVSRAFDRAAGRADVRFGAGVTAVSDAANLNFVLRRLVGLVWVIAYRCRVRMPRCGRANALRSRRL
jgi:hypothetical protein